MEECMVLENSNGFIMEKQYQHIKVNINMVKSMEEVKWFLNLETFMMENGLMVEWKEKVF